MGKDDNRSHTPIVAITAYALEEEQQKSILAGCDRHLSKPILKQDLLSVVDQVNGY